MKRVFLASLVVFLVLFIVGCSKQSVAFDAQNETPIFLQEVSRGKTVQMPDEPTREGYDFLGWYTDISGGEKWDFSSPVTTNLNLYGHWEPLLFSIEFILGIHDTMSVEMTLPYGQVPKAPVVPEREGYRFTGWFTDAELTEPYDMHQPVVEDTVVYAGWEKLTYTLVYHVAGADDLSLPPEQIFYGESEIQVADKPIREGYAFVAWNTQSDGQGESYLPGEIIVTGYTAMELYAQWAKPVAQIDAGSYHTLVLYSEGTLVATGNNGNGQLGNGTRIGQDKSIVVAENVAMIRAGGGHSLFIDNDGVLWGMGANYEGQLGSGSLFPKTSPIEIANDVASVAAGGSHSMILKKDGTLWTIGNNEDGQLGDGSSTNRSTPVRIADNVKSVSAGLYHSAYVKEDGSLWTMGWNQDGQLGDGSTVSRSKSVRIDEQVAKVSAGGNQTFYIKEDGSLWATGANGSNQLGAGGTIAQLTPVLVSKDVVDVATGATHSLHIDRNGSLWGVGDNSAGQLTSDGTPVYRQWVKIGEDVKAVSAGDGFSIILRNDGQVSALGANDYGQLGEWGR